MARLPTESEISPFDDLDGKCAADHLLGKDVPGVVDLLKENSLYFQEDYLWMGPKAFCFYAPALIEYLRSPDSNGDLEFAYFMPGTFRFRLENDSSAMLPVVPLMREFCFVVEKNFERLEFDSDYRRRFKNRTGELERAIAKAQEIGEDRE